ncbi:MAG: hypothetical protein OHK0021_10930 [Bryobacter sp.]
MQHHGEALVFVQHQASSRDVPRGKLGAAKGRRGVGQEHGNEFYTLLIAEQAFRENNPHDYSLKAKAATRG